MMGVAITLVCGCEAPEVQEPRARAHASSVELTSFLPLTHACGDAPFFNGGVSVLSRAQPSKRVPAFSGSSTNTSEQKGESEVIGFFEECPL